MGVDIYKIEGPAKISFSGGRTSGYMLACMLAANGGKFDDSTFITFANTGKERSETLDFVHEVEQRWNIKIHWLEYRDKEQVCMEVDYKTASRSGEPFSSIIGRKQALPNPIMRYCTTWMKIKPMERFMRQRGFDNWDSYIGIRADEPRRVAKIRGKKVEAHEDIFMPLVDAGVTKQTVMSFWQQQDFDLLLKPDEGNCDLCFLKGKDKVLKILETRPDLADWWVAQESRRLASKPNGTSFRIDRPDYAELKRFAMLAPEEKLREREPLPLFDQLTDCFCHD